MNNQKKQQPQIKLDGYSKQKLGRAYYALYNALVAEGQAHNMTLGTSWYNALFKISDILKAQKSNQPNVAVDYLMAFYMSHRKGEIEKMMTAKDRNNTIESAPDVVAAASDKVKQETENLRKAIQSVVGGEVLITLAPHDDVLKPGFIDWVAKRTNTDLHQDPRAFEREYRKYVMRQKHK